MAVDFERGHPDVGCRSAWPRRGLARREVAWSLPCAVAYSSDFAVSEGGVELGLQKARIDAWTADRWIGSISYLIDPVRRDHPAVFVRALDRLLAGAWRRCVDLVVEALTRFAEDPATAMRAALVPAERGIRDCEVGRFSNLKDGLAAPRRRHATSRAAELPAPPGRRKA